MVLEAETLLIVLAVVVPGPFFPPSSPFVPSTNEFNAVECRVTKGREGDAMRYAWERIKEENVAERSFVEAADAANAFTFRAVQDCQRR